MKITRYRPGRGATLKTFAVRPMRRRSLSVPGLAEQLKPDLLELETQFQVWQESALEGLQHRWRLEGGRAYSPEEQRLLDTHRVRVQAAQRQQHLDLQRELQACWQRTQLETERLKRASALELSKILERERYALQEEAKRTRSQELEAERRRLETQAHQLRQESSAAAEAARQQALQAEQHQHAVRLSEELGALNARLTSEHEEQLAALKNELSLQQTREMDALRSQLAQERATCISGEEERLNLLLTQERALLLTENSALLSAGLEEIRTRHQEALEADYVRLEAAHSQQCAALKDEYQLSSERLLTEERERLLPELKRQAQEAREGWLERWAEELAERRQALENEVGQALDQQRLELQARHAQHLAEERDELGAALTAQLSEIQVRLSQEQEATLADLRAEASLKLEQAMTQQRLAAETLQHERTVELKRQAQDALAGRWAALEAELLAHHHESLAAQAAQLTQEAETQRERQRQQMQESDAAELSRLAVSLQEELEQRTMAGATVVAANPLTELAGQLPQRLSALVIAGVPVPEHLLPQMTEATLEALQLIAGHSEVAERDLNRLTPPDQSARRFRRDLDGLIEAFKHGEEHVFVRVTRHDDTYYVLNPRRSQE